MENKTDNRKWYVITTRPRAEKLVSKRLTESEIENYLPLRKQLRSWHDRKKWVETPLFPSYIFVRTYERLRSKVFNVSGILRYLSIGGCVCVLSESEIERVKRLCSYEETVTIEQDNFESGDWVEIIEGHLIGIQGELLGGCDKHKLKISIEGLHCSAMVLIDKSIVRRVS